MDSKSISSYPVGVLGAGSFGTALANLLAENRKVLLYSRREEAVQRMNSERTNNGTTLHDNVTATADIQALTEQCYLIYPVVPSSDFRSLMREISPLLGPHHILIHGTKGMDIQVDLDGDTPITREHIKTMSEVIVEETKVLRVGCVAGPNLAKEIYEHQPAATVIASRFNEVIEQGQQSLKSTWFQTYGSPNLFGIELAGVLKNYIAIAAGATSGLGYGENARALLLTRGMAEMIYIGRALGAEGKAFMGVAGIGDLIATCSSPLSRNFTVGNRLAKGEALDDIISSMNEVAEGVKTVKIVKGLSESYGITAPIAHVLYRVMFQGLPLEKGVKFLMRYPAFEDAEYID